MHPTPVAAFRPMEAPGGDRLDLRITQHREDREIEFGRIVAFSDGVLAIAITLLVLNVSVPDVESAAELTPALLRRWPELLSYGLSFAVIGRFWIVHHRFFGTLERFDPGLIILNLVFLGLIGLVPFTTDVLDRYGSEPAATIAYAAAIGLAGLANWAMIDHALRRDLVRRDARDATLPYGRGGALLPPAIFLLSIPVALISPFAAKVVWGLILVVALVRRRAHRRSVARRGAGGSRRPA